MIPTADQVAVVPQPEPTTPSGATVDTAQPEKRRVMVATLCYGGMLTEPYFQSVIGANYQAAQHGIDIAWYTHTGESLVTRGRNESVRNFLDHPAEFTDLLFIDADIEFQWENIQRLLDGGHEVSGALYPLKTVRWDRLVGKTFESKTDMIASSIDAVVNRTQEAGPDGFAPCIDIGTGFMLIRRTAIEKLIASSPELKYTAEPQGEDTQGRETYALFDTMIRDDRYLSEDYAFCRRWQDIGGEVFLDMTGPILVHHGTFRYGKV